MRHKNLMKKFINQNLLLALKDWAIIIGILQWIKFYEEKSQFKVLNFDYTNFIAIKEQFLLQHKRPHDSGRQTNRIGYQLGPEHLQRLSLVHLGQ